MSRPRILVAGIGNIFLGDDGFGVEVARLLSSRRLPDSVRVVDFGIRGRDLAYELLQEPDVAILVDVARRGHPPGTLCLIEAAAESAQSNPPGAHSMDPVQALATLDALGGKRKQILVLACEPESFGDPEEGRMSLSPAVQAAVPEAARMIESLVGDFLRGDYSWVADAPPPVAALHSRFPGPERLK